MTSIPNNPARSIIDNPLVLNLDKTGFDLSRLSVEKNVLANLSLNTVPSKSNKKPVASKTISKNNDKANTAILKSFVVTNNKNVNLTPNLLKNVILPSIQAKYGSLAKIPENMHVAFDSTMNLNTDAFVDNKRPNEIKVNSHPDAAIKRLSEVDLKRMLTHETLHAVANDFTNSLTDELDDQVDGKWNKNSASVILIEGFAELFTKKLTGKISNLDNPDYQAYHDFAKRIEDMIGTQVCEKAYFSNDMQSRHKVIMALSDIQKIDSKKAPVAANK